MRTVALADSKHSLHPYLYHPNLIRLPYQSNECDARAISLELTSHCFQTGLFRSKHWFDMLDALPECSLLIWYRKYLNTKPPCVADVSEDGKE